MFSIKNLSQPAIVLISSVGLIIIIILASYLTSSSVKQQALTYSTISTTTGFNSIKQKILLTDDLGNISPLDLDKNKALTTDKDGNFVLFDISNFISGNFDTIETNSLNVTKMETPANSDLNVNGNLNANKIIGPIAIDDKNKLTNEWPGFYFNKGIGITYEVKDLSAFITLTTKIKPNDNVLTDFAEISNLTSIVGVPCFVETIVISNSATSPLIMQHMTITDTLTLSRSARLINNTNTWSSWFIKKLYLSDKWTINPYNDRLVFRSYNSTTPTDILTVQTDGNIKTLKYADLDRYCVFNPVAQYF